jgi:hypothetical protein
VQAAKVRLLARVAQHEVVGVEEVGAHVLLAEHLSLAAMINQEACESE